MYLRLSSVILVTVLIANNAAAQVQITGVDRSFQAGVSVTIDGSGFGTKEFSTPWLWDDLTHESYADLNDGDYIPSRSGNSYGYVDNDGLPDVIDPNALYNETAGWPVYRTTHPQQRVPNRAVISCGGRLAVLFDIGRPHGDTEFLYLDFWYYSTSCRSEPPDGVPGYNYNKIFRISPSTESFNTHGHSSIYPGRLSYDRGEGDKAYVYSSTVPTEGVWTHVAVWTDGSGDMNAVPGESEGILKIWSNNDLKIDVDDQGYKTWPVPDHVKGYSFVHAIGIETAGGNSDHSPPYANLWGDIYMDNTMSRVALGDASTWSQVQHYELQIPQYWQPQTIQVTSNLGSFESADTVWLYVFDANGNVNENGVIVETEFSGSTPEGPGQPGQPVVVDP